MEKETVFWDRYLPGFGVRVYALGTKMYVVQSWADGKSVRVTVGGRGVITADEARRRAARVVNRIKAGEDPVAEPLPARHAGGLTVADLAVRYKGSTADGIRKLIDKHILPAFGRLALLAMERERVVAFHARLSSIPNAANRTVAMLSRMYRMAASWGMVPDRPNPCRGSSGIGRAAESGSCPTRSSAALGRCSTVPRRTAGYRSIRWRRSGFCR